MFKSFRYLLILFVVTSSTLLAQSYNTWKSYTSVLSASSIAMQDESTIWVGTSGGVYRYKTTSGEIKVFTNTEGLSETRVTSIAYDSNHQKVWIGFESGAINSLEVQSNAVEKFTDIERVTQYATKGIRDFFIYGDSVFVATDFGVSVLVPSRKEFRESYTKLGTLTSATAVNSVFIDKGNIYVATSLGVAKASLNSSNLIAPSEWEMISGLASTTKFAVWNDTVFAATSSGLYSISIASATRDDRFGTSSILGLSKSNVLNSASNSQTLFVAKAFTLFIVTQDGNLTSFNFDLAQTSSLVNAGANLFIADKTKSLVKFNNSVFQDVALNTPAFNSFDVVKLDSKKNLWVSSAQGDRGAVGFAKLNNGSWTNYKNFMATGSVAPANQFSDIVERGTDLFLSSWGLSLIKISEDNSTHSYNNSNSSFVGITGAPGFIVLPSMAVAENGIIWISNFKTDATPVYAFLQNEQINKFGSSVIPSGATAYKIAIDVLGRKWVSLIASSDNSGRGVVIFDDRGTLSNTGDDRWTYISSQSGYGSLPNNRINAFASDNDGAMWFATEKGAGYFFDVSSIAPNDVPNAITVFDLRDEVLSSLAVDALNRKWFGSKSGVWLVTPDGSDVISHYTSANSGLISNDVRSIAYDRQSGKIYVGTGLGLSVLSSTAVESQSSSEKLKLFPNPFITSSGDNITIEGILAKSQVKILTVSGTLIRTLKTDGGGVAIWDGLDSNGKIISSGVYIAVSISEDGKKSSLGKIAVIQK